MLTNDEKALLSPEIQSRLIEARQTRAQLLARHAELKARVDAGESLTEEERIERPEINRRLSETEVEIQRLKSHNPASATNVMRAFGAKR